MLRPGTYYAHPWRGLLHREGDYSLPQADYDYDPLPWRKVGAAEAAAAYAWFGGGFQANEHGYVSRYDAAIA